MSEQGSSSGSASDHGPARAPSFEERMDRWGKDVEVAGERFGREAEAAGKRLAANPVVADAADTAARVWGLLLLAVGVWFLVEVTIGYDLPSIPWGDIWPIGLIVVGLVVILRGATRRRA